MTTHIFYAPHADDETLSMGVAVLQKIAQSHRVILVLLTDGAADMTLKILRGEIECGWHRYYHDPIQEGFPEGRMDKELFIQARQSEFIQAARILGVPEEDIHIHRQPDGGLDKKAVRDLALSFEQDDRLSGARCHHTMSYHIDDHPDHLAAGNALLELYREKQIALPRWYVKRYMWNTIGEQDNVNKLVAAAPDAQKKIRDISHQVYGRYVPSEACYAVGYHSVKIRFEGLLEDYTIRWHEVL